MFYNIQPKKGKTSCPITFVLKKRGTTIQERNGKKREQDDQVILSAKDYLEASVKQVA